MKDFNRFNYRILHAPSLIERGADLIEDRRKEIGRDDNVLDPNTRKYHEWRSKNPATPQSGTSGTNTPSPVAPSESDGKTYTANTRHHVPYGSKDAVIRNPSETPEGAAVHRPTTPKALSGDFVKDWELKGDGHSRHHVWKKSHDGSTRHSHAAPQASTPKAAPNLTTPRSNSPTTPKPF